MINRPYRSEKDYEAMCRLSRHIYALSAFPLYATACDLDWWRYSEESSINQARVWFETAGELMGFAWPAGDEVDVICHPACQALEDEMLAWAEDNLRGQRQRAREAPALRAWAYGSDAKRQKTLTRRGYECSGEFYRCWRFQTRDYLPEVEVPAGYALHDAADESDILGRVWAHRAVFGIEAMDKERYLALMSAPTYRPELDVAVEAGDGEIAAFCLAWLDEASSVAVLEPVGCLPAYRGRGLARAAVVAVLRQLRSAGAGDVFVTSWWDNEAATGLYHSLGFRALGRNYAWDKSL